LTLPCIQQVLDGASMFSIPKRQWKKKFSMANVVLPAKLLNTCACRFSLPQDPDDLFGRAY